MNALQKQIFEMLMESQFWLPDQMLAFQRSQLTQLLLHATENVQFYKTRLDPVFKRNGDIDWDRWHEIPIVTRTDLRDRHDEMLAAALPAGHGPTKRYTTSGSSGVPVAVEVTRLWGHANRAAAHRFHKLQGIELTKSSATVSTTTETGERLREEYYFKPNGKPSSAAAEGARALVLNRNLSESG